MNTNEKNSDKRNLREKIKNFWKNYRKNWIWVNIGGIQFNTFMLWFLFFLGIINLALTILLTVFYPSAICLAYYGRKSKHQRVIGRLITVIGGGLALGFPIWIFFNYILLVALWAPFHEIYGILRIIIFILVMLLSYSAAAYIMDKLGKRRDYRPFY